MRKFLTLLVLLIVATLSSCSTESEPVAETPASSPTTNTIQPTETAVPSATPTHSPTPEPTSTPTAVVETETPTATLITAIATDDGKITLNGAELLDIETEAPGCFTDIPAEIAYAPTNEYFLVIPACIEQDNQLFVFRADGTDKQQITGPWDYLNGLNVAWADDGLSFTYERLNSCCASPEDIPADAPPVGLVQVDVLTGEKVLVATPTPRP
jgi:hypothetical protein